MRLKNIIKKAIATVAATAMALSTLVISDYTVKEVKAAPTYDVEAAMAYAAANWNNGQGLCAEFVSRCVQAGGINIYSAGTGPCARAIMRALGMTWNGQDADYGWSLPQLVVDGSGNATYDANHNVLQRGDVVVQWCNTHNIAPHILICAGYDSQGKAIYYAHNGAINAGRYNISRNTAYQHTTSCDMVGRVIHITGYTSGKIEPQVTQVFNNVCLNNGFNNTYVNTDTDALLYAYAKASYGNWSGSGVRLYKANGTLIAMKDEAHNYNRSDLNIWYPVNSELGVTLNPGTQYYFTIYTVYNGKTFESDKIYFTTTGTCAHNYTSTVTKEATTTETGSRLYYCSKCEHSYTETIAKKPVEVKPVVVKQPAATAITSVSNVSNGISLKWKKVSDATGYIIYRSVNGGKYAKVVTIGKNSTVSYTDKVANSNGKKYTYKVYTYKKSGNKVVNGKASAAKTTYRLKSVSVLSVKNLLKGKITVTNSRNAYATGYLVQYSKTKDFKKSVTKTVKTSITTISQLTKGQTYYVRVAPYKTVKSTKYVGQWSGYKKITIKK